MKKLLAMLCVVALLATLAVSAFAAGSQSSANTPAAADTEETTAETEATEDAAEIVVVPVDLTAFSGAAADALAKATDPTVEGYDVDAFIEDVYESLSEESKAAVDAIKGEGYDFASDFATIGSEEDGEVSLDGAGAETTVQFEVLKGVDPAELENYKILLIDGEGQVYVIDLDAENFDSETGEVTVAFPAFGAFALIQK